MNDTNVMTPKVNGIDLHALGLMVEAINGDPAEARVEFRVRTGWTGGTRSETVVDSYVIGGETIARRFKIVADEPLELCGANTAPNPQELLMAAVNACMTVGYVANAALRGINLSALEIEMHGELDLRGFLSLDEAVPAGYREIAYTVRMQGDGDAAQYREIHDAVMRTSPNFFNMAQPIRMNGRLEAM
jgi:uncharacterized OsmC-like protein